MFWQLCLRIAKFPDIFLKLYGEVVLAVLLNKKKQDIRLL